MTGLVADRVSVVRGGNCLLRDASLTLNAGELLVIVGPNGAGKSTLLATLAGDITPDRGAVTLDSRNLGDYPPATLAARRAVVGSPPRLAFDYRVRDVIAMGWLRDGRHHSAAFGMALASVLDRCELVHLADRIYMTLSSGERQRAEYARALMQLWREAKDAAPRWLLLDEPTANLDVAHAVSMLDSLQAQSRAGDGILVVLHDLDLAARFADRVALVADGEITALGTPAAVLTSDRLTSVYRTPIHVEHHRALNRLVVIG